MTLRHHAVEEFERRLHEMFGRVDRALEAEFGSVGVRDPRRPPAGSIVDHTAEGLFHLSASFSAGLGSAAGPGYVVTLDVRTVGPVPLALRRQIEDRALELLQRELAAAFQDRELRLVRDGPVWKIVGDLSLGRA
ncbi:MAG: hypothetical protein N2652_06540 [Kiritimatiellae bacterium]|nr:hypothetical protein [Kiritimatiellia bacterium]